MRHVSVLMIACQLGFVLFPGCGTMVPPPPSSRIVASDDGYYRSGRNFSGTSPDWETDLVRGNLRAEALVKKSRWERRGSWAALGLALLSPIVVSQSPKKVGLAVGYTFIAVSLGAFFYWDHRSGLDFTDAINAYNDDVFAHDRVCWPPLGQGAEP
jgi:hypothetical protein